MAGGQADGPPRRIQAVRCSSWRSHLRRKADDNRDPGTRRRGRGPLGEAPV